MSLKIAVWSPDCRSPIVEKFLERPAFDAEAERVAARILRDIKGRGVAGILEACESFDGVRLHEADLRVSADELTAGVAAVTEDVRRHVREAHRRVSEFARRSLRNDWSMSTAHGGELGEVFRPFERVGVYIPGGTAPLASTVVMTATLAQVAGVPEIVACTPCAADKSVNPALLYAMQVAGVTEVYRVGGIQAIGLMAYGTETIAPVQKIAGPGGAYVTAAKRQVYGTVALDLVAGPSEIAVLADRTARADWVAADLLSQIEHGTGQEKALLVTDSADLAEAVKSELERQVAKLPRSRQMAQAMEGGGVLMVTVETVGDGIELVNRFAPEHFELMVEKPEKWLPEVRCAGAVFIGDWTPESAGDFVAGPSHVLPTGGAAKLFSGLTVDDFRRRTSHVRFTREDLADALPTIEAFGVMEGLEGHARSARIRFTENE